jgi:hypothetical protein
VNKKKIIKKKNWKDSQGEVEEILGETEIKKKR